MSTLPSENDRSQRDWQSCRALLGGMLGMVVAMGIGRFAFTPILPLMQRDLAMTNTLAGWLAGLNYLGYLAGAILCSLLPQLLRSRLFTGTALVASLATTVAMGVTLSAVWWGILRLGGGFASAVLFIVISAEVAEALARRGHVHWLGALYGGVGLGIALSGLLVPVLDRAGGWEGAWIGMGVVATGLALAGIAIGRTRQLVQPISVAHLAGSNRLRSIWPLAAAYFCEGLGYIVTATFLVAIIAVTPGLEGMAPYSWVVVGVAAIPSTLLWPLLARRIGTRPALLAAYALQAAGILVSSQATSVAAVLFAAFTFGGTFMGIVAMTLAEGSRRAPHDSRRVAAVLTACFGVGQVLGPVVAGVLADLQAGFAVPLLLAAAAVMLGAIFIAGDRQYLASRPR